MECLIAGAKEERALLHAMELPTAQLCAMTANLNRNEKKQRKPFTVTDFCFFISGDDESKPEARAAIAYWTLVDRKKIPSWALFCLRDFSAGKGKTYPTDPAFIGEGLILLAPQETEQGLRGTMLAEQRVSGKQVAGTWEGQHLLVSVPIFDGFVAARAETELIILRELAAGAVP